MKKNNYVIDVDLFYKAYEKETGEKITIYQLAEMLGVSYQTVSTLDKKPVKGIGYLKRMAGLCGLPINKLVKKCTK